MNNQYQSILEALEGLQLKGYSNSYSLTDKGLYCLETKQTFNPNEVRITEFHRFEGSTDYNDMSIIYALEMTNGSKGILIDAFGTYADTDLSEFIKLIN